SGLICWRLPQPSCPLSGRQRDCRSESRSSPVRSKTRSRWPLPPPSIVNLDLLLRRLRLARRSLEFVGLAAFALYPLGVARYLRSKRSPTVALLLGLVITLA